MNARRTASIPLSGLGLGIFFAVSCWSSRTNMLRYQQIKTAEEIRELSGRAASRVLSVETAATDPVPRYFNGTPVIQILYYPEYGDPGDPAISLPDHCMLLDPMTGKVIRFWHCTPSEIGIQSVVPPVTGAGLRPGMTPREYSLKRERLRAISKPVWQAFFEGGIPNDSDARNIVREYHQLFLETTTTEVASFTVAAAPEFFQWLDTATR